MKTTTIIISTNFFYKNNNRLNVLIKLHCFQKVVKEMNRLGMVIDLSGSSNITQVDVLSTTSTPVIFSRGAAATLCNNSRNIQDEVLELLVRQQELNSFLI